MVIADKYSPWPSRPHARPKTTSYSWRKVEWDGFNADVERPYNQHPCHATSPLSAHANTKALTQAYRVASKNLKRGCQPDPVSWLTPEVPAAMERRVSLRRLRAKASRLPEDWEAWAAWAKETQSFINGTERSQWRDFLQQPQPPHRPGKVIKVLKAINGRPAPPNPCAQGERQGLRQG